MKRDKYWWLWPDFHEPGDARDPARMGVGICGLIAATTVVAFYVRYYSEGDLFYLGVGLIVSLVYCALGYGILKMSRVAASTALALFAADKLYGLAANGAPSGKVAVWLLFAWPLIQANRAVYWFHREADIPTGASLRKCGSCGADYRLTDYRADAAVWLCSQCRATLPGAEGNGP